MPVVQNPSRGDVELPDGTLIPAGAAVMVDDKAWKEIEGHRAVKGLIEEEGRLVVGGKELPRGAVSDPLLDAARHGDPSAGRRVGVTPTPHYLDAAERLRANTEVDRIEAEAVKAGNIMKPVESELLKNAPAAASTQVDPALEQYEGADKTEQPSPEGAKADAPKKAEAAAKSAAEQTAESARVAAEAARAQQPPKK
jgi:hypothetical protein